MLLYTFSISQAASVRTGAWQAFSLRPWLVLALWLSAALVLNRQMRLHYSDESQPAFDPFLLPAALLLSGWGALEITRLSPDFGLRQAVWLGLSVLLFCIGLRLPADLNFLRRYKYLWLTGGLALTALTIFFGVNPTGSSERLWLGCCGVYLQPSEPLKLLLIIYMAAYLADRQYILPAQRLGPGNLFGRLAGLAPLLAPTLVMVGLALSIMVVQHDLGTASIFLFLYTVMVYLATGNVQFLWAGGLGTLLAGAAGYSLFDVVRLRVDAWISPWTDPSGRSFQVIQSLLAVASGGVLGRGPGLGSPSLVPVAHSDFIFTAIAEETGLLGALGVLLLVGLLAQRGMRLALQSPAAFPRLLAAGLSAYLAGQSILIAGGNLRLLPLTGVTLPFLSYGGSSLLVSWVALLLLVLVNRAAKEPGGAPHPAAPYYQLSALLAGGLACAGLLAGWWSIYRAPDLLNRTDNARRSIADRFTPRGPIVDRANQPINQTTGQPGSYTRHSLYPALAGLVGYNSPVYGQAGLENSLDPYLRGVAGRPESVVAWNELVYAAPPPGLAVRLSIDLRMQAILDQALGNRKSAGVLLNADSGEILALASHPGFDPDRLDENWNALLTDPDAPLLNRAVQGLYPPGAALSPLLLAAAASQGLGSPPGTQIAFQFGAQTLRCAGSPAQAANATSQVTWAGLAELGCPEAAARLGEILGGEPLLAFFQQLGLYSAPEIRLPAAASSQPVGFDDAGLAAVGLPGKAGSTQVELKISPLQLALAAAPLSASGRLPAARLALSYQQPDGEWILFPLSQKGRMVLPKTTAQSTAELLADPDMPVWTSLAHLSAAAGGLTWFTAGTLPAWQGSPLILVLLLEEDNPDLAQRLGKSVFSQALQIYP